MSQKQPATNDTAAVDAYMASLVHPLKQEIQAVRDIIRTASTKIGERIKWAAPSFFYLEDLVTFNHRQEKFVQLVFHHKAIVSISSPLLTGNYPDRRLAAFTDMGDIRSKEKELIRIIRALVKAMEQ